MLTAALVSVLIGQSAPPEPWTVSDYDSGDVYFLRGEKKQPHGGLRDAWVFNRAMVWLGEKEGIQGAILCHSSESPLLLTGSKGVSRWYAGEGGEVSEAGEDLTRFTKRSPDPGVTQASLPPFQFHVEQHPAAVLEVNEATHPWQFLVLAKGRSGPPLFASPWRDGPGNVRADLLGLCREKGYRNCFAELQFFVAVWTKDRASSAGVTFRLRLEGAPAVISSLPVIRTRERAESEGVPIHALVLDGAARRLGRDDVRVTASVPGASIELVEDGNGVWKGTWKSTGTDAGRDAGKDAAGGLTVGDHEVEIQATWIKEPSIRAATRIAVSITDGKFVGYDPKLKLLTLDGKPRGPFTGSYRGQVMFQGIGTPRESPLQGQKEWDEANARSGPKGGPAGPDVGFHWWESLTEAELDADFAYLARCGWSAVHLCQGWIWWERLDAGGKLAPHGAEQLAAVLRAARRHGIKVLFALTHYPLGQASAPYAQYLEAGYRREDYDDPGSRFYSMVLEYVRQFAAVFRDETAILGLTAAGEGDPPCGQAFVGAVHDAVGAHDGQHLFLSEPHHNLNRDPNWYRKAGWKPVLGGTRTYFIDRKPIEAVAAQFKVSSLGDLFMAEGLFWGYMDAARQTRAYRERVRETIYTGLAYRSPILMTWEERVVEDERTVLALVREQVDWRARFRKPRLGLRVGEATLKDPGLQALWQAEAALSRLPLEYSCLWEDEPAPPDALLVLDARAELPRLDFRSEGGDLPDELKDEMPLRLPAGFAASYSWSEDRRTLLALVRDARKPLSAAEGPAPTTEGGSYTYADTTRAIERDVMIDAWEVECVKPGTIQLIIFRKDGGEIVRAGKSELVEMKEAGPHRFKLAEPIAARKGDWIGFHIPSEATEIAAETGGRMLYLEGALGEERTPADRWKEEPKTARIRALNLAEESAPGTRPAQGAKGASGAEGAKAPIGEGPAASESRKRVVALRNFPPGPLEYCLFDLETRKAAARGRREGAAMVELPAEGEHFFLRVGGAD